MMREDQLHGEIDSSLVELRDLLADFAAGELTDEQDAKLQQLAIGSKAAWQLYIDYMFMYGAIQRKHCHREKVQELFTSLFGDADDTEKESPNGPSSNSSIFPLLEIENDLLSSCRDTDELGRSTDTDPNGGAAGNFFGRINFSFLPGVIMVISSVLILSALVIMPIYWSIRPEPKWDLAALVTNTVDCQWKQDSIKPSVGSFLVLGQKLELELGLAELEFASGAKVILEGPAEFTVAGENTSNLALGRLTATVPEGARGFTVVTPNLEVVDLGTEFGISVQEDGNTDVHVFQGVVEAEVVEAEVAETEIAKSDTPVKQRPKLSPKRRTFRLEKNQAVQYDKATDVVATISIDQKSFVRNLDFPGTDAKVESVVVINPSFESPDIRTIPEFQQQYGNASDRPIDGWKVSGRDTARSKVVTYQILPYDSPVAGHDVGPDATDGQQVATISFDKNPSSPGPNSRWIYQSLGKIDAKDLGRTLKLHVDGGPGCAYGGAPHGDGVVLAGFALHVTPKQSGKMKGSPASFRHNPGKVRQLHHMEAELLITPNLVGQKLFIILIANDFSCLKGTYQYHFDNVKVIKK